ncbi:MAG TPA: FAD-dependent oxidoreductase [Kiritimatiellia bacterium]|nr:FAD-dependent oxidoreductase [Kiritimatiellia bacterium]
MAGLRFLQEANRGEAVETGKRVVVIGGGFTSVDCARMAKRLGAETVQMVYRRSEAEMYITPGEVEEMVREGIVFQTHAAPVEIVEEGGRASGVRFVRTEPGEVGGDGRRGFAPVPGSEFEVGADLVLLATGQEVDPGWMEAAGIAVAEGHRTSHKKVFLAGDFGTGAGSLIDAIADGKGCARVVDKALTGEDRLREVAWIEGAEATGRTREMDFIPRQAMPVLGREQRGRTAEVETGYDEETAKVEASRCYLCHYKYEIDNDLCIYCDRCLKVKPVEDCIVKVSALTFAEDGRITGYTRSTSQQDYNLLYIDQSKCIRCGACKEVCPVECISLQKVSLRTVACGKGGCG